MAREPLLTFDPSTGFALIPTEQIREGWVDRWTSAFFDPDKPALDTDPTTPAGQLVDGLTAESEAFGALCLFMFNMFDPMSAEGRWQDALGHIYFIERKIAEPTVVTCQLTGLRGTVIPYGALVSSTTGYTLICNRSVTIGADSTAETTFRCSETGPIPFGPHSVTQITTVIPGWDSVDNEAAGALGRDVETRGEFEARRAASVAANAHGSTGAIYGTLANIPGVLDVQVLENIGPDPVIKYGVTVPGHGITVCIYGGDDGAIAEAIYRKKDNGADTGGNTEVVYTAPDYYNAIYRFLILRPETINFRVRVTLGAGNTVSAEVQAAIKQAVVDNFNGLDDQADKGRVGLAQTVFASRFYCSVLNVEGVRDIVSIEIALGDDGEFGDVVQINGDQEPTIAPENVIVQVAA